MKRKLVQSTLDFNIKKKKNADVATNYNIIEGDSLSEIERLDSNISLIFSSPPYNIGKVYEKKTKVDAYLENQGILISKMYAALKKGGSICWQVGNYVENGAIKPLDDLLHPFFIKVGFVLQRKFIWMFGHGLHCQNRFSGRYETISWYSKGDLEYHPTSNNLIINNEYNNCRLNIPNVKSNHVEKTIHPCQFPVELVERFILLLTVEGDIVLDPYNGVGSTMIAALNNRRSAIGIELKSEYNSVTERRINQLYSGNLQIRPLGKQVYEPDDNNPLALTPLQWKNIENPSLKKQAECLQNGSFSILPNLLNQSTFSLIIINWNDNISQEKINNLKNSIKESIEENGKLNICFIEHDEKARGSFDFFSFCANFSVVLRNRIVCWNAVDMVYTFIYWFSTDDYYFDLDAVRVPSKYPGKKSPKTGNLSGNPLGKNPSDVWLQCEDKCLIFLHLSWCHFQRLIQSLSNIQSSVLIISNNIISEMKEIEMRLTELKRIFYYY